MVPRSKLKLETVSDGTSITATSVPDIREKRGRTYLCHWTSELYLYLYTYL